MDPDQTRIKRRYFSNRQKQEILEELDSGLLTHSDLARKHGIHPITIYNWKRMMSKEQLEKTIDYQDVLNELDKLKEENNQLKKAVGELTVDKMILETANEIYKKKHRDRMLKQQKKSLKN